MNPTVLDRYGAQLLRAPDTVSPSKAAIPLRITGSWFGNSATSDRPAAERFNIAPKGRDEQVAALLEAGYAVRLVIVDNMNGKFTITRSAANDEPAQ
jgi:hypothetical protein